MALGRKRESPKLALTEEVLQDRSGRRPGVDLKFLGGGQVEAEISLSLCLSDSYYLILSCGYAPPQPDSRRGWRWGRGRAPPQFHPLCHSPTPGHHQQHKSQPSRQPLGYRLVRPEPKRGVSGQLLVGSLWGEAGSLLLPGCGAEPQFCPRPLPLLMPLLCLLQKHNGGVELRAESSPHEQQPFGHYPRCVLLHVTPIVTSPDPQGHEPPHCCSSHAILPLLTASLASSYPSHLWGSCEGC